MIRVFIYGSCVTRDAVPWFAEHGFEMVGYVARQSLASAFKPADVSAFDLTRISSPFQRRMAEWDISSRLAAEIKRCKPDLVLWDLCDERLTVRKLSTGGMLTESRDYVKARIHPGPLGARLRFGQDLHMKFWKYGLQKLSEVLESENLASNLYLNATPWALIDEFGNSNADQAASARIFNQTAEKYISLAEANGAKILRVPQEEAISRSEGHQWGPAPFHYVDETYKRMLTLLREETSTDAQ